MTLAGAVLACLAAAGPAPDELAQALKANQSKDYPAFLKHARAAAALEPTRPRVLLVLASAQALGGAPAEAPGTLERLASMGLSFKVDAEHDFDGIRSDAAFVRAAERLAKNQDAHEGSGETRFTLDAPAPELVEGVTFDAARKRFLIGSVRHRKIIAVDEKGAASDFVASGAHGVCGVFGLAIRGTSLFATSACLPQVVGFRKEETNRSGLFEFDAGTGALLGSWWLETSRPHVLGDVTVSPKGEVFATDSAAPAIYRLGGKGLETFVSGSFRSLQGAAFSVKGERLYVADYALGLFVIDIASRKITRMKTPLDVASVGIDGLYFSDGSLVATQNGIKPARVIRFMLDRAGLAVTGQKVLLVGDARVDDLSLGALVGDSLVINAHSGWAAFDDSGTMTAVAKPSPFISVPLR